MPGRGIEPYLHHPANHLGLILSRGAHSAGEPFGWGGAALCPLISHVQYLLSTLWAKILHVRPKPLRGGRSGVCCHGKTG